MRRVSNPIGTSTAFGTYITTDYWSTQPKVTNYYDGVGRTIKTVYQDSTRDSVAYGDNWVKTWDAVGDTAIARTNGPGMADTTVNGLGLLTIALHNKMGQDSVITDASGKVTYCYYDTLGRIKGTNGPDASSSYTYKGQNVDGLLEYDQLGNITSSKNAKAVVNYTYDPLSRISKLDSAGTDKVLYKYDSYYDCNYAPADTMNAKGRLTRLITAGIDTTWMVYDKLGRTIKTVYALAGMAGGRDSIRYIYNAAGACTSMVYPDGANIRYTYNGIGQLTGVPNYISSVVYNADGTIKKISNSNFTNDSLFYNNLFKITRIKTSYYEDAPPSAARMDLRYTYWADGNIKKVEDYLNTTYTQYYDYTTPNNSYDATGRLQRCAIGANTLTYSYDNVGNRTQETVGGTTNSFSYTSGTNKLSTAVLNGTTYSYSYDDVGNIISKTWFKDQIDNCWDYNYNYSNLLAQVTLNGSRTVTNYYGGGGATRVKKTDSQLGSRYYGPLSEHDSTGSVKKKYINALGRCIAFVDSASNTHWMHQDAQGSTKLITNASGSAENAYKYYPFGDSLSFTGTVKNDVKYTGQSYVDGVEAYDYGARYYDPEIGRFYSRDPLGSAATSPYAYCGNDPVNFTDPSGMMAEPYIDPEGRIPGGTGDAVTSPINWALMSMSSNRWTPISPEYGQWYENEIISYHMSNAAKYNYWETTGKRTENYINENGILCSREVSTTEGTYFNVISMGYEGYIETSVVDNGPVMFACATAAAVPLLEAALCVGVTYLTVQAGIQYMSKNKHINTVVAGLQRQIDIHTAKMAGDPNGPNRDKWKAEMKAWKDRIERLLNRKGR